MGEVSKALGTTAPIVVDGVSYEMAPFSWDMVGAFEAWLESRAWAKVERCKDLVSEEVYNRRYAEATALVTGNQFSVGTPAYAVAMATLAGKSQMIFLQLREKNPGVKPELVEKIMAEKYTEIMAKAEAMNRDPDPNSGREPETGSPSPPLSPSLQTSPSDLASGESGD